MKNIIIITIVFFLWIFASISNETIAAQSQDANFNNEEDLAYNEFILPCYPDGIRADWNGVYGTYLDYHTNDDQMGNVNINHQVSTESTSLLAHYAALRGDQQAFEQMYDLWNSENYFLSQKYKLEHWILDSSGMKYSTDGKYANASGEEVRMVEALKIASDKFTPTGGRDYKQLATTLTEGLKGVGGGQGNFEPYSTTHNYVYSTDTGDGGVDIVDFQNQATRYVRINCLTRNTEYGDSILEVEIYGPDGTTNFALTGSATASSVEGPDFEANNAIDGSLDTRWASAWSDPQYLEIDLGAVKTINKVIIHWEYASAESYNVDASIYGSVTGYLLRPWFVWLLDGTPTSAPDDPAEIYLNYNNFLSYYYAVTWLGDSFYQNVIDCTLKIVLNAQNKDSSSPGKGLIKPLYDMSTQQYAGFNGATSCSTVSDFDLTIRLGAYGHLVNNQEAINAGQLFFDFIKTKYINDGVIWAGYDYSTGEPVDSWNSLDMYAFFAQLAIEYRDYDLGEKILKEKILPYQVAIPTDPGYNDGYYGAFKVPASKSEAEQNIFKDASAFANLEILKALYLWNNTDKETWTSSYPKDWATVASITTGDGGEDVVDFDTVNIRYLKILCKENNIPDFGYSIFTLQVFGPDMTDLAVNKTVSISSAEGFDYTGFKAVDDNDATRWSSELKASPQWIYVDLGENKNINKVRILWENAYAVKYDIQVGNIEAIPNQLPQASIVLIQPNPCEISQLVTFTANAIDLDGDSDIRFITWEFGDGQSSAGGIENKIQTHIYTAQGTYSVNLTVEDKAGHRITDTSSIIVNKPNQPPVADEIITTPTTPEASPSKTRFYTNSSIVNKPNQPPVAKIVAMPTAWVSPLKVRFYGDRSIDPDGQIKAYNWNFGDGSTSQIKNPTHTYYNFSSSQQQYTVTLIVKDNKGAWSSKVSTVIAVKPRSNSK